MACWHGKNKGTCPECLQEQDDGSTWKQQANDVWSGGERMRRVHTKRVGIKLYDCEHGILRSHCTQGCGGGAMCEHGKRQLLHLYLPFKHSLSLSLSQGYPVLLFSVEGSQPNKLSLPVLHKILSNAGSTVPSLPSGL
jgi:hypothetical protein